MEKTNLKDMIDLKIWKALQDNFAAAIKLPTFTINPNGDKITMSRDFPFFCQIVLSTEMGAKLCKNCWMREFKKLEEEKEKIKFYYCHAGLMNIMVPIIVKDEQLGAVVCCSILDGKKNVPIAKTTSKSINVKSLELLEAINEVRQLKEEQVKMYGNLLYILSNTIPEVVYEKYKTEKKVSELTILHKITQMVTSTLDLEKILASIMKFLAQTMNAQSCSTIIIDEENTSKKRYFLNQDENGNFYEKMEDLILSEVIETKNYIVIPNIRHDPRFENSEVSHKYGAIISMPLRMKDAIIGAINIYGDSVDKLKEDDLKLISIIADQVSMAVENAKQYDKIKQLAITDKLTGMFNRRHFMELLDREVLRSKRSSNPISVAILDVDDFGHYNNIYGHPTGDKLLKELSQQIKENIRSIDMAARYGGEEFVIIMPETKEDHAAVVCERVRNAIESYVFYGEEKQPAGTITVSIGLATCYDKSLNGDEIVKQADKVLYQSKSSGKNKVTIIALKNQKIENLEDVKEIEKSEKI